MALVRCICGIPIAVALLACGGEGADDAGGTSGANGAGGAGAGATTGSGAGSAQGGGAGGVTTTTSTTGTGGSGSTGGALGGCKLFPSDNLWNTPIDALPLHPSSDAYVASIGLGTPLHPDFGTVYDGAPNGIPFLVVPADETAVPVSFTWADESDPGPYPVPQDAPIEGGPAGDGDRHVLVVQQGACTLYELFNASPTGGGWDADSGAIWHLDQNEQRPAGWTSADASGLAILPGLVRYDEAVEAGAIEHALRVTVSGAQSAFIPPASHSDGQAGSDPSAPPMGLRLRLKADVDVSGLPPEVQVIAKAMKKYGLVVVDTGGDWYVSGAPDDKWSDDALAELGQLTGADFEAVDTGQPIVPY